MARRSRYRRAIEESERERLLNSQKNIDYTKLYGSYGKKNDISNQSNNTNNDGGFLSTLLSFISSIWH